MSAPQTTRCKRVKKLLILMHPDFTINLPLKGTKQHIRIEAAFKKLVGLRRQGTGRSGSITEVRG
jgi:hypothetical protein